MVQNEAEPQNLGTAHCPHSDWSSVTAARHRAPLANTDPIVLSAGRAVDFQERESVSWGCVCVNELSCGTHGTCTKTRLHIQWFFLLGFGGRALGPEKGSPSPSCLVIHPSTHLSLRPPSRIWSPSIIYPPSHPSTHLSNSYPLSINHLSTHP